VQSGTSVRAMYFSLSPCAGFEPLSRARRCLGGKKAPPAVADARSFALRVSSEAPFLSICTGARWLLAQPGRYRLVGHKRTRRPELCLSDNARPRTMTLGSPFCPGRWEGVVSLALGPAGRSLSPQHTSLPLSETSCGKTKYHQESTAPGSAEP